MTPALILVLVALVGSTSNGWASGGRVNGLASATARRHLFDASTRLFLLTGLLGGFTTFSAFAYETYFLGREQAWTAVLLNIRLQVIYGLGAVGFGHWLISR